MILIEYKNTASSVHKVSLCRMMDTNKIGFVAAVALRNHYGNSVLECAWVRVLLGFMGNN